MAIQIPLWELDTSRNLRVLDPNRRPRIVPIGLELGVGMDPPGAFSSSATRTVLVEISEAKS
jgi:hypothetical protein